MAIASAGQEGQAERQLGQASAHETVLQRYSHIWAVGICGGASALLLAIFHAPAEESPFRFALEAIAAFPVLFVHDVDGWLESRRFDSQRILSTLKSLRSLTPSDNWLYTLLKFSALLLIIFEIADAILVGIFGAGAGFFLALLFNILTMAFVAVRMRRSPKGVRVGVLIALGYTTNLMTQIFDFIALGPTSYSNFHPAPFPVNVLLGGTLFALGAVCGYYGDQYWQQQKGARPAVAPPAAPASSAPNPAQLVFSPDGTSVWDGQAWRLLSPDRQHFWNGQAWVPSGQPPSPGA